MSPFDLKKWIGPDDSALMVGPNPDEAGAPHAIKLDCRNRHMIDFASPYGFRGIPESFPQHDPPLAEFPPLTRVRKMVLKF